MVDKHPGAKGQTVVPRPARERPVAPLARDAHFGSDVAADTLRALEIAYITLNPGASFRGLHDSLVNRLE
jgi:acetolactate synthase I/II/III large subunit